MKHHERRKRVFKFLQRMRNRLRRSEWTAEAADGMCSHVLDHARRHSKRRWPALKHLRISVAFILGINVAEDTA